MLRSSRQPVGEPLSSPRNPVPVTLRMVSVDEARNMVDPSGHRRGNWAPGYPGTGDVEAATAFLSQVDAGLDPTPFCIYEILDPATDTVVGGIGFHGPPDPRGHAEIGYGVVPGSQNRGYATAAVQAMVRHSADLGVARLTGRADLANTASRRVLEKAGLRYVGLSEGLAHYELVLTSSRL
jgi:RimJ/RimL family protein N-acetyltransferase